MLTGLRPFRGEDVSEILAAVIKQEPQWDGVPLKVRRLLKSCLEKDPKNRLRDIGDVWRLLDEVREPQVTAPSRSRLGMGGWIAAGVLAVIVAVGRPSAVFVGKDDTLYVSDSQSNSTVNQGYSRGITIGSAKDGSLRAFIPDPDLDQADVTRISGASGIVADSKGTIYAADVGPHKLRKYVLK